jgi:hypothetical protein
MRTVDELSPLFECVQLASKSRTYGILTAMKLLSDSYFLGFLMVVGEMLINTLLLASGVSGVSAIPLAAGAGMQYTRAHGEKMPGRERMKALSVYFGITGIVGILALLNSANFAIGIAILAGTLLIFGVIMYFSIGLGSTLAIKMLEKQRARVGQQ